MATSDPDRLQAHLQALAQREAEALVEYKQVNDQAETVRARAIAGELERIARRRRELMLAMPRET
ncbi:MAG: hypothetical protein H0W72_11430 [Planctomycetes bacterium]|nr:hypothetical protein [Planctomycetota bacterium]